MGLIRPNFARSELLMRLIREDWSIWQIGFFVFNIGDWLVKFFFAQWSSSLSGRDLKWCFTNTSHSSGFTFCIQMQKTFWVESRASYGLESVGPFFVILQKPFWLEVIRQAWFENCQDGKIDLFRFWSRHILLFIYGYES